MPVVMPDAGRRSARRRPQGGAHGGLTRAARAVPVVARAFGTLTSSAAGRGEGATVTVFLVVGVIGVLVIVLSLVLDDVLEGMFDSLDIDIGSGLFSTPVIGAFLAAFGFGGALLVSAGDAAAPIAALGGVGAGVVMGGIALWITRALMHMPTDEPVRTADLVGKRAEVLTRIPAGGYGEIAVHHSGQRLKLNALASEPVAAGTVVVIVSVSSPSSVMVEPERTFWGTPEPGGSS